MNERGLHHVGEQPAPPAPFTTVQGETFTHCTMPERAVLDAMFAVPEVELRQLLANSRGTVAGDAFAAELARRGLK